MFRLSKDRISTGIPQLADIMDIMDVLVFIKGSWGAEPRFISDIKGKDQY